MERRNSKGSGLENDGVPPRGVGGDRLAFWAALGRGVDCVDDITGDVRRLVEVRGVCAANFEAGSPRVLKGEARFKPVAFILGDSGLVDVFVA